MVASWKVKRELARIVDHSTLLLKDVLASPRRNVHDWRAQQNQKVVDGKMTRGPNVALYLLFQPNGLLASTISTCNHLVEKGFSVFIVSNAPLSDQDRTALTALSFGVMERENFGYDFGGYRDGILHLLEDIAETEKFLVLNDSVWFPTLPNEDFLEHVLSAEADVYGAVLSQRKQHVNIRHLQSYAFSFGRRILHSKDFEDFWTRLPLSNNREWTIRRSEMGLTNYFRSRGYSVGARWDFDRVAEVLPTLTELELKDILEFESKLDLQRLQRITTLLEGYGQVDWRQSVIDYINSEHFRKFILLLHPVAQRKMNFPFVKKSREHYYTVHRPTFVKVLGDQCLPEVLSEMSTWD
jgi:lipopolysaccharide biosynthesis protein